MEFNKKNALLAFIEAFITIGFSLFVTYGTLLTSTLSVNLMYANEDGKFYSQLFVFESFLCIFGFIVYAIMKRKHYLRMSMATLLLLWTSWFVLVDNSVFVVGPLFVATVIFSVIFIGATISKSLYFNKLFSTNPELFKQVSYNLTEIYNGEETLIKEVESYKLIGYPTSLLVYKIKEGVEEENLEETVSLKTDDLIRVTRKAEKPLGVARIAKTVKEKLKRNEKK